MDTGSGNTIITLLPSSKQLVACLNDLYFIHLHRKLCMLHHTGSRSGKYIAHRQAGEAARQDEQPG